MTFLLPDWTWTPDALLAGVGVRIVDGRIAAIGAPGPDDTPVRLPGRLLLPGLVNAHSHAFQRAFRGHVQWRRAGQSDFWTWRDAMYRTANALTPEGVAAVSRLCFLEMAEAGVTQVGEFHYLHHQPDGTPYEDPDELAQRVIGAALDVGIRITLLRVVYARNGPDQPLRPDQQRFADRSPDDPLAAVQRLRAHADPRVKVGLAPHSVRAVPAAWMPELSAHRGPTHAHVSEQPAENAACLAEHGRSPLQVLADGGLVDEHFTAVHLTVPLAGDVDILQQAGGAVCACPITEQDLGDGFLPVEARTGRVCVGSDSQARIDLLEEARSIELHARAIEGRRNVLAPEGDRHGLGARLLQIASTEGDRALGGNGSGIVVGAPADLMTVDLRRPAAEGVPPLEAAAFVATPEWIDGVWVGGQPVVRDGVHPERDAVLAAARPHLAAR